MDPCIPASWPEYRIAWRVGQTRYRIHVENPERLCRGIASAALGGEPVDSHAIPLVEDGGEHEVRLVMGKGAARAAG